MYSQLFRFAKSIVPRISKTELIALQTGDVHIDRQIFKGAVDTSKIIFKKQKDKFDHRKTIQLLDKYGEKPVTSLNTSEVTSYLGKNNFFGFIIPDKYGGKHLSAQESSSILTKISSKNPSLGVTVMVPNSLGPGELISNYGTQQQKETYLPKLADGTFIPCFGLTGPNNGSDALGSIDKGKVIKKSDGKLYIKTTVNKRYITLAPIANLVGLAINLEDPDNLLDNQEAGITVLLIEKEKSTLKMTTHHNPLNVGFPNGTVKGTIEVPLDAVIGGPEKIGEGWKMLMECLAAGRGICLPATANASSKVCTYGIFNYIKHRKQFNIPLIKMEGVTNKFCNMMYNTWLIHCSIKMTNTILDEGYKPAVISAIMKQQTTERGRQVINESMDIHAGSAICLGQNNFSEKFYKAAPIGITVEGSNTLTRNLIIFGQGLNKSHPHIYPLYKAITSDNQEEFKSHITEMINHTIKTYFSVLFNSVNTTTITSQTLEFANLANFIALLGGEIKKNQSLSGDMADLLSNLYLAHSVIWYHEQNNVNQVLRDYCLERLIQENTYLINRIIDNYPSYLGTFLPKSKLTSFNYNKNRVLIKELQENPEVINIIKDDIYLDNNMLKLGTLDKLDSESNEYKSVYQDIISVGEFDN